MGMNLQHITGFHARFTAHNRNQRSTFLHELPDTCICEWGICSKGTRNVSTAILCGINRNTCDKNILRNGTITMFCLSRQCSCSLCCVQESTYRNHITFVSTPFFLLFLKQISTEGEKFNDTNMIKEKPKTVLAELKLCDFNRFLQQWTIWCRKSTALKVSM